MINKGMDNNKKFDLLQFMNIYNIVGQVSNYNNFVYTKFVSDNYDKLVTEYNHALKYFIEST